MVAVPVLTAVNNPVALTVATVASVLVHVPPETVSVNALVVPAQSVVEPDIVPPLARASTVIADVAVAVPQELVTL